jgi:hypothetical protein
VALVRKRTIPTERPPLVGEVSANFCGWRAPRGQRDRSLMKVIPLQVNGESKRTMLHNGLQALRMDDYETYILKELAAEYVACFRWASHVSSYLPLVTDCRQCGVLGFWRQFMSISPLSCGTGEINPKCLSTYTILHSSSWSWWLESYYPYQYSLFVNMDQISLLCDACISHWNSSS